MIDSEKNIEYWKRMGNKYKKRRRNWRNEKKTYISMFLLFMCNFIFKLEEISIIKKKVSTL